MRIRSSTRRAITSVAAIIVTSAALVAVSAPASAVVVGICTIKANYPHGSTHVSGTINGVGTISCTKTMTSLYINVKLLKSGGPTWYGTSSLDYGVKNLRGNSATSCSNGPAKFKTSVEFILDAPPGYKPDRYVGAVISPWRSVACGVASRAAAASDETVSVDIPILSADG